MSSLRIFHPDNRTEKVIVIVDLVILPNLRFTVRGTGQISKQRPHAAADIAASVTAAGGQYFPVYQLPLIGVVGDRQAEEVGLFHVVWLTLIFLTFKVMQMHGVPYTL